MKFKSFREFVLEQNLESDEKKQSIYSDLIGDVKEMIEKSLNSSDQKTSEDFISAYLKDSEKNRIEGLINDADIYEFYLKYKNNIDEILSDINFYDDSPSDKDVFSLYDYIISGTKEALKEIVKMMQK